MVSAPARVEQARFAQSRGVGLRRACALIKISRSSLYYHHRINSNDDLVIRAMKELSARHPRFGVWRIRVLLKREGLCVGKMRCRRLWAQAGLQVPKKKRRKLPSSNAFKLQTTGMNTVWSYDFVHDSCANGQTGKTAFKPKLSNAARVQELD